VGRKRNSQALAQSPEGQATLDAIVAFEDALTNLDTIIAAANANPQTAWDTATPQQRTAAIKNLALAVRGIAWILRGVRAPLGTSRVPE
jgi:hypothetical protein